MPTLRLKFENTPRGYHGGSQFYLKTQITGINGYHGAIHLAILFSREKKHTTSQRVKDISRGNVHISKYTNSQQETIAMENTNYSRFDKYDDSFDLKPIPCEDGSMATLTASYEDTKALVDKAYVTDVDYGSGVHDNVPLNNNSLDWDYELNTAYWEPLPVDTTVRSNFEIVHDLLVDASGCIDEGTEVFLELKNDDDFILHLSRPSQPDGLLMSAFLCPDDDDINSVVHQLLTPQFASSNDDIRICELCKNFDDEIGCYFPNDHQLGDEIVRHLNAYEKLYEMPYNPAKGCPGYE